LLVARDRERKTRVAGFIEVWDVVREAALSRARREATEEGYATLAALMFGSNPVRARPTAAACLAGLCLWVACSSGENDFFKQPPLASSGQAGSAGRASASGGSTNQSGGASAGGGSTTGGTSEAGGSTSMAGETGAGSGGTDSTGGTGNTGGTRGNTGGTGGDTGANGGGSGTEEGGAGEGGEGASAGEGGVAVGGSSGVGGTTAGSGGAMAGGGGTAGIGGIGGIGIGGIAGSSGAGAGTAGASGLGGAGMSGSGGTSAGAGGISSSDSCSDDGACSGGRYCKKESCDAPTGVCATKPSSCTGADAEFTPVCGCDHMTYYTACVAAREGVNVAQSGECTGTTVPCTRTGGSGSSCSPARSHAACYRTRSSCNGAAPDAGVCWVLPDECPNEKAENTYCNLGNPVCVGLCEGLADNDPLWRNSSSCSH
jgi:hypothetical protein